MCRTLPILAFALAALLPAQALPEHASYYVDASVPGPGTGQFNDPFKTINQAIAASIPHDFIFVRPGLYAEAVPLIDFIFLRSTDGPETTVIDATGQPGSHAVTCTTLSEINGFTIRKADGAGIHAVSQGGSEFGRIIRGNRVIGCPAGGIWCEGAVHPAITETVVANCGTFGVRFENGASPFFTNNTITGCAIGLDQVGAAPDPIAFFANSIIWGNGVEVQGLGPADLISCDVGDPAFVGVNGSFDADPLFRDPAAGDYRLPYDSPCLELADPNYVLQSSSYDNRGYGAWRKMDGDHDGVVLADVGAFERGGLDAWQVGTGTGSQVHVEIATGPWRGWFLGYGPFSLGPTLPLPTAGSTHSFLWLEESELRLFGNGVQDATGRLTIVSTVPDPCFVGLRLPIQALGVDWQAGPAYHFTNADLVVVR